MNDLRSIERRVMIRYVTKGLPSAGTSVGNVHVATKAGISQSEMSSRFLGENEEVWGVKEDRSVDLEVDALEGCGVGSVGDFGARVCEEEGFEDKAGLRFVRCEFSNLHRKDSSSDLDCC